jgi:predicted MFS family arabinose efflux permease
MWQLLKSNPLALAGLAFAFWLSVGNDSLFVVLGLWLESFGLSLTAVGVAASVIGLAELAGEALTASLGDRVGLNRALMGGLILTMVGYLLLPFSGISLPLALIGLFGLFLFFEFSVVTSISLFTEVMPETRATMMSALFAAFSIGRVVGALLGGVVWNWGGLVAVGTISALTTALGLACLGWGLRAARPNG